MKTAFLITHPENRSTEFLRGLYNDLPNKTVITGGVTKTEMVKLINSHQKILCCGHGSPNGLFGVGKFPEGQYVIDESMVTSIRNKATALFIWCNADQFVHRHGLTGFHTGMFLSQMSECLCFGVECSEEDIKKSNYKFAEVVAQHIHRPPIVFYKNVLGEYGQLAHTNPVAIYNHSRLFLNQIEPSIFADKVSNLL